MKLILEGWRKLVEQEEQQQQQPASIDSQKEAAQWLANQIYPLIQQADAGNFTEPLKQLVARLNSPEGMSPEVRDLLKRGQEDGAPNDEAIQVKTAALDPSNLIPTQGVIDLFKSVGFNGSNAQGLKSVIQGVSGAPPILAAGDGDKYYIIDGHHRWSGATVFNVNCKIPANVIIMDPGKALLVSQLAIAAYVGAKKVPSAQADQGRSIIGPNAMSAQQVKEVLSKNVGVVLDKKSGGAFLNPEVIKVILNTKWAGLGWGYFDGTKPKPDQPQQQTQKQEQPEQNLQELVDSQGQKYGARKERILQDSRIIDASINKIAENCGILAKNYSQPGPAREIMPQFDPDHGGPKFKQVQDQFSSGAINFSPKALPVAESKIRRVVREAIQEQLRKSTNKKR